MVQTITPSSNKIKSSLDLDSLARYLLPISLVYLGLPAIIFFVGWLNPFFALLCTLLMVIPFFYNLFPVRPVAAIELASAGPNIRWSHLVVILIVTLLITGVSGAGGYGHQDSDWLKHNAILKDLVQRPWPVVYEINGISLPMVYYIAYYLPAALAGKWLGPAWTNHVLLFWSLLGLVLSILWFIILVRRNPYLSLLLFMVFSGLDAIGMLLHLFILGPMSKWDHFEWWAENWQYSSNVTLLFFVPHQALCGWILTGILLYHLFWAGRKDQVLYYLSLSPLWSPLITLGLLPYLAIDFWLNLVRPKTANSGGEVGTEGFDRLKPYFSVSNLCGLALLTIYGLFYSAKFYNLAVPLEESVYGFIFNIPETDNATWGLIFHLLIWFILLEFGLYAVLMGFVPANARTRWLWLTTIIFLAGLPLLKYGRNNDLVMRVSIPALFIFAIFLTQALSNQTGLKRAILVTLILIGAITPLVEITRHLEKAVYEDKTFFPLPDLSRVDGLFVIQKDRYRGESFLVQYLGSASTPFFKFMAKNSNCQPPFQANLKLVEPEPLFYALSDRFTLTCIDKQLVDGHLIVNLFLQTRPPLNNIETHDTLYVHLVNEQGDRIAGSDILLYKSYEEKTLSIHDILLPPDIAPGSYRLVVGTYYFDKETMVNVSSVNLDTMITVN